MINKLFSNKGFSLIELSIVLIILDLLVAGVSGGVSLIKSTQLRSVVTKFTNYKTAYNSYYAQFGEVPGVKDEDPNSIENSQGFKALYKEGLIDKEPYRFAGIYFVDSKFGRSYKMGMAHAENLSLENISDISINKNVISFIGTNSEGYPDIFLTYQEAKSIDL